MQRELATVIQTHNEVGARRAKLIGVARAAMTRSVAAGRRSDFTRSRVTHLNVATFRQNVGLFRFRPALWRGAATSHRRPREVSIKHAGGFRPLVMRGIRTMNPDWQLVCLAITLLKRWPTAPD